VRLFSTDIVYLFLSQTCPEDGLTAALVERTYLTKACGTSGISYLPLKHDKSN